MKHIKQLAVQAVSSFPVGSEFDGHGVISWIREHHEGEYANEFNRRKLKGEKTSQGQYDGFICQGLNPLAKSDNPPFCRLPGKSFSKNHYGKILSCSKWKRLF